MAALPTPRTTTVSDLMRACMLDTTQDPEVLMRTGAPSRCRIDIPAAAAAAVTARLVRAGMRHEATRIEAGGAGAVSLTLPGEAFRVIISTMGPVARVEAELHPRGAF